MIEEEIRRFLALRHIYVRVRDYFPQPHSLKIYPILSRWVMNEISFGDTDDVLLPTGKGCDDMIKTINFRNSYMGSSGFLHIRKRTVQRVCIEARRLFSSPCDYALSFDEDEKLLEVVIKRPVESKINMKIPQDIFQSLCELGVGKEAITCLFLRYHSLFSQNLQLSIPGELSENIRSRIPVAGELFASFFNRHSNGMWCSLFPDLESVLGSYGNYFKFTPKPGVYFANPPFDVILMARMASKMVHELTVVDDISFILTLPLSDPELRLMVDGDTSSYPNFECVDILNSSGFVKCQVLLTQNNFHYIHNLSKQQIGPCSTHFILISNSPDWERHQEAMLLSLHDKYDVHTVL